MKIFRLVVASLFLAALMISSSVSAEGRYKIIGDRKVDRWYFNGDKNYIFCGASMGMGDFVIKDTVNVEKYEPPIYIISADDVSVSNYFNPSGDWKMRWRHTKPFRYDYSKRKMYLYTPDGGGNLRNRNKSLYKRDNIDFDSEWTYVFPNAFYGEGAHYVEVGEIAFALAYKLKFYGLKGYNGSDFYEAVRGVVGEVKDGI